MADADAEPGKQLPLFHDVYFAIIPSPDLTQDIRDTLADTLISHGATQCTLGSDELSSVTHLVSTTADFPAYHDAVDAFIHVVKPSWVEQSIAKGRTANPRQHSPDPRLFLSDIIVTCADDLPQGDKDAIVAGVQAMGGQYGPVLTKLTTHIVALTMENKQCKLAVDKKLACKVVLPHWFDACLLLGRKIDCSPYLLPDPPLFAKSSASPVHPTPSVNPDLCGASSLAESFDIKVPSIEDSPSEDRQQLKVFKGKAVVLHSDLDISAHLNESLADLIQSGGGTMVTQVDEANMFVCRYRGSKEFKMASRKGVDVGNLNWLYYIINHNRWTSPFRRLLHYPYPQDGIPGFEKLKITVSNYAGEARIYLESLVKAAGGQFTKTMAQENTHLITAHTFSEKCEAAKEWNIDMVNHLWLEESYARHKIQSLTNPRYTTFPQKTNLGEVVGQTQVDREAVEALFFPPKRQQLENLELNTSTSRTPSRKATSHKSSPVKSSSPAKSSSNPDGVAPTQRPAGGRGAKNRALNKLQDMASDIALFEKESKRVGGVVYGGRKSKDGDRTRTNRKRGSSDNDGPDAGGESDDSLAFSPEPKKQKSSKQQSAQEHSFKILVTGVETGQEFKSAIRTAKLSVVNDPLTKFDVLVAPRVLRTPKFLCGLAQAPMVVGPNWLKSITASGKLEPPEGHLLHDTNSETELSVNLSQSLQRAKQNLTQGGLLNDWTIFCTQHAHGGFEAYERIVRANGGRCLLYKGRETYVTQKTRDADESDEEGDHEDDSNMTDHQPPPRLHLISSEEDKPLWSKFRFMAEAQGYTPVICRPDWIIHLALNQDSAEWLDWWSWE